MCYYILKGSSVRRWLLARDKQKLLSIENGKNHGILKKEKTKEQMKYYHLLAIWILVYLLPPLAGGWYDLHFHFYQASLSLLLILIAYSFRQYWYVRSFMCVSLLCVTAQGIDYIIDSRTYDNLMMAFSLTEFVLLFIVGGIAQLRNAYERYRTTHRNAGQPDRGSTGLRG